MKTIAIIAGLLFVLDVGATAFAQANTPPSAQKRAELEEQQKVAAILDQFLDAWLINQDIDKAVTFFDKDEIAISTKQIFEIPQDADFKVDQWLRKALVMWLFESHGDVVAEFGHGDPRSAAFANAPMKPEDVPSRIKPKTITEALTSPLVMGPPDAKGQRIAGLIFKHAARDGVLFVFRKISGEWKIVVFSWMVG